MPKIKAEDDEKHGDKLQALERTGGSPSPRKRGESTDEEEDEEEPAPLSDDDDDPVLLQDEDDEDFQNDDIELHRDVGDMD